MFNNVRAILFDFDGTLIDSMPYFADVAARVLEKYYNIPFREGRKRYLETSGIPFFMQLEIIVPGGKHNKEAAEEFERDKQTGFFSEHFNDDVRHAINTLRDRGIKVGVSSNNFQHLIDRFVKREGLEFDFVLGYRDGFDKGKPHFDYIIDTLNIKKSEMIFVGDSIKDMERAMDYGIGFIARLSTFTIDDFRKIYPDVIGINKISELLDIVKPGK